MWSVEFLVGGKKGVRSQLNYAIGMGGSEPVCLGRNWPVWSPFVFRAVVRGLG